LISASGVNGQVAASLSPSNSTVTVRFFMSAITIFPNFFGTARRNSAEPVISLSASLAFGFSPPFFFGS